MKKEIKKLADKIYNDTGTYTYKEAMKTARKCINTKNVYKFIVEIRTSIRKPQIISRTYFDSRYSEYGIIILFIKIAIGVVSNNNIEKKKRFINKKRIKEIWNEVKIIPTIVIPTVVAIVVAYKYNSPIGGLAFGFMCTLILILLFWWNELD